MSVNTGGFFFSNPTSAHLPGNNNRDDEKRNAILSNNGGVHAGQANGYNTNGTVGMPCNFNANVGGGNNQQMQMANQNLNQGNFLINNQNANMNGNLNMGNPANNMGNIVNMGNNPVVNNPLLGNQNIISSTANVQQQNAQQQQNVNTGGFGSFFFNPLQALFSGNINNNNVMAANNTNQVLDNNTLGVNNMNSNSMGNMMGGVVYQQQQNQPMQMHTTTANPQAAPALPIDQFGNQMLATPASPMAMTFMTPNQGPTPCHTPPAMFLDAQSFTPQDLEDSLNIDNSSQNNNQDIVAAITQEMIEQPMVPAPQDVTQGGTQGTQETASQPYSKSSIFRGGISSIMGTALGAVATYVNQSFLSGIPFHIADRAMKESKETYAKWWEDGINVHNKRSRRGSTDIEDMDDSDEDTKLPVDKKRKLGPGGNGSTLSVSLKKNYDDMGIDTSSKFIEYQQQQHQARQNESSSLSSAPHQPVNIEVHSSIIKPRRSQFERKERAQPANALSAVFNQAQKAESARKNPDVNPCGYNAFNNIGGMYDYGDVENESADYGMEDESVIVANVQANALADDESASRKTEDGNPSGYNAFNNIGGMYDFGVDNNDNGDDDKNNETNNDGIGADADGAVDQPLLTYDSLGSYYTTNEDNNDDASLLTTKPPAAQGGIATSSTITSNSTLDDTMRDIKELLDEKNRASEENEMLQMLASPRDWVKKSIRSELIDALQCVQGDVKDKRFLSSLDILSNFYKTSGRDARVSPWSGRRGSDPGIDGGAYGYSGSEIGGPTSSDLFEGCWVNMGRPNYVECLGNNAESDFMYTLGRMSFDMFQPGGLICSVQSTHNTIKIIGEREELPAFVPKSLREEVASLCDSGKKEGEVDVTPAKRPLLRSYE